ncbi:hypothetical protein PVAND_013260 [Polypedilum vanderplanki]|uniref:RNA polymerase I-specific transcription initiation factor RRN3 n=1 Tax=Polypedilum vanderplanki TaxID=319348 RepID=A0A9J6CQ57_POLVA|nr:hypothetical protein PVAND_013260 [Polypedilum vanderplanki]
MSVISDRKSIGTSILKSNSSLREEAMRKSKQIRFADEKLSSVKEILNNAAEGNNKEYMDLIYRISIPNITDENLMKALTESINCIQVFKIDFKLFVETLLKVKWIRRSRECIELYHKFILCLLTAKPEFLAICTLKILSIFIPDDDDLPLWKNGLPNKKLDESLQMVHDLIKKILEVIPMLPVTMKKNIREMFPSKKNESIKCAGYVYNILKILDYCPNMMSDILDIILEILLSIDVHTSREQIEDAEEEEVIDENNETMAEIDDEDKMKLPVAETLDLCMNLLFDYFYSKLNSETETSNNDQKLLQHALFLYFDEHILTTKNSKHVHFLFFYIASFRRSFLNYFLQNLLSKMLDRNKPTIIRQTAIGYLSSLLARAKFMPIELVKKYLLHLTKFAHDYIQTCNSIKINLNPRAHLVFHATCQAIFYVIAFRSKDLDLINSKKNLKFLLSLDLSPIVKHSLNPLNYCLPSISEVFDNVMKKYQILYCHTILAKNKSKKIPVAITKTEEILQPEEFIESVFPFDPYILKKSGKKIHPIYVEYQPIENVEEEISPTSQKRIRNESECDDFYIVPTKKLKTDILSFE